MCSMQLLSSASHQPSAPVQSGLWNVSVAEMQAPTQAALFEYMAPMAVHAIVPPLGSSHAVTQIELRGSGYIQARTACVFGAARTVVAALVMSSSVLRCNAPSHEEGEVAVEVTGNDGSDISADGQVYRYVADAQVQRVEPSHGPADGGTTMTVWGQHFAYTDQLACVLGSSQRVRARWVSSSMVTCTSTPWHSRQCDSRSQQCWQDSLYDDRKLQVCGSSCRLAHSIAESRTSTGRDIAHTPLRSAAWTESRSSMHLQGRHAEYASGPECAQCNCFPVHRTSHHACAVRLMECLGCRNASSHSSSIV